MRDLSRALPLLTADQLAELQSWVMDLSAHPEDEDEVPHLTNVGELLYSWSKHVQRFEDELDKTLDDETVWIEYDWQAAQYLRDTLANVLEGVPDRLRQMAEPTLRTVDEQFERISRVDEAGLQKWMYDADDRIGHGWWWQRLPLRGPVVDALLERPEPGSRPGPTEGPSRG